MNLKNPTRTESLLANIAGYTGVPVPDMKNATRSERLLKEILDNGGGGGGDVTKEYVDNAIADAVTAIDEDISDITDAVENKVDKVNGKSLSTNDYTDADKALVQDSPITITATASPISTANGKLRKLAIYGKSEVVDGAIVSAGEGGSIEIETCQKNLLDPTKLVTENITYTNGTLSGTAANFNDAYRYGIPVLFSKTRQITFSAKIYTNGADPSGDGLRVSFVYQDNRSDALYVPNNVTTPQIYTLTSNAAKQIKYIGISFGSNGLNMWYLSEIQLEYGSVATTYEPYNGTMATFSTGTPLRGIPDSDIRDVMQWDGSSGEVTKNCNKVKLTDLTWQWWNQHPNVITANVSDKQLGRCGMMCSAYPYNQNMSFDYQYESAYPDKAIYCATNITSIFIKNTDYNTKEDFVASLGDAELVYELATPTTEQLTTAENASIATLRTFEPQTHAQNNAGATMTVEAYAGTANGQAVSELKQDVQSEISALKITQSGTLTLTTAGWSNNTQTVTYEHNIGKRNTIDVELASIKAWTAAGILATAETASTITFECDTVPTSDLSFRITSMEVR